MAKILFEKFTHSSIEKIFKLATSYDMYQNLLCEYYKSVRIISVRPTTTLMEVHLMLCGKEFVVMQKHAIEKPFRHEIFFVGGDCKGTHISEEYLKTDKGTKITLSVDFKHKGAMKISKLFDKNNFESEFSQIMDNLIKISES